jgi:hypothetical protein
LTPPRYAADEKGPAATCVHYSLFCDIVKYNQRYFSILPFAARKAGVGVLRIMSVDEID